MDAAVGDDVLRALEGWHDFYLAVATASATLTGLLFVAVSLNLGVIVRDDRADLRVGAFQTFTGFIRILFCALLFLVPRLPPAYLGSLLALFGLMGVLSIWRMGRRAGLRRGLGGLEGAWRVNSLRWRFFVPTACYLVLAAAALALALGWAGALYALVAVFVTLLGVAARNAWDLLVLVGRAEYRRGTDGESEDP